MPEVGTECDEASTVQRRHGDHKDISACLPGSELVPEGPSSECAKERRVHGHTLNPGAVFGQESELGLGVGKKRRDGPRLAGEWMEQHGRRSGSEGVDPDIPQLGRPFS